MEATYKEGAILTHRLEVESLTVGKSYWQELETTGHTVSTDRKLSRLSPLHSAWGAAYEMVLTTVGLHTPVNQI